MGRKKRVAVVRCCGTPAYRREETGGQGGSDCASLKALYLQEPESAARCACGCLGGGSCLEACPAGAVFFRESGCAAVDRGKCLGCGKCVKACPQQLIMLVPAENTMQPLCVSEAPAKDTKASCTAGCIGCGICEKACPAGAVRVIGQHAVIDQELCIACGMCAAKCPRGVIHDANGIITVK